MSENDKAKFLIEEIKTSDADCGEVCVTQTQTTEVYYESGKVSMIRTNENVAANVKVIKDGKKGVVATNDVSSTDALKKNRFRRARIGAKRARRRRKRNFRCSL